MPAASAPTTPDLAPPDAFAAGLQAMLPGWNVSWQAATLSTNADMQEALRAGQPGPLLIGAHAQTSGRGRAGRPWQAKGGDALLFSCGWQAALPPAALPPLSLVAGLVACEALGELLGPYADGALALKWPNDVQWGAGKLAGILAETVAGAAPGRVGLVLGIGVNLRGAPALTQALGREVADWSQTGGTPDAARIAAALARAWQAAIKEYAEAGFAPFQARYARWDALFGQSVRVIDHGRVLFEGRARGVDAGGRLQVECADGLRPVTVGDVSVRASAGEPA